MLQFNNVASSATTRTTLRMRYTNGDASQRFADVTVNGQTQRVGFAPSPSGQITGVAAIHVNLNSGSSNTIRISGVNGGWGKQGLFLPLTASY